MPRVDKLLQIRASDALWRVEIYQLRMRRMIELQCRMCAHESPAPCNVALHPCLHIHDVAEELTDIVLPFRIAPSKQGKPQEMKRASYLEL